MVKYSYPKPNLIVSDRGYEIERGDYTLRYSDDTRTFEMDFEFINPPEGIGIVVYKDTIVLAGSRAALVPPERRQEIIANIREAFGSKGVSVDVL
ncbi:hypothetical protein [Phenylobacterium sp.]|uniref:hypothetical protein n=1 Tax=Phenylobacterium sp. TaxID=1871053 RepID=UPI0025E9FA50|nr:hypothetical protein [Phenylobacterium sp.]